MSALTISTHGVMEGGGSYNLHAKVPAGGGDLALPHLEEAARSCTLLPGSDPIVIADYGSSQGKNVADHPLATSHPHRFEGIDDIVGEQLDSARRRTWTTTLWNVLCVCTVLHSFPDIAHSSRSKLSSPTHRISRW